MIIEMKVPSPGESITEVQIAAWLVEDGAYVEKDSEIVEVDSDKATLSISAEESGKIKILVEDGETVEVGSIICSIDTDAEGVPQAKEEPKEELKEQKVDPKAEQKEEKKDLPKTDVVNEEMTDIHVSPLARKVLRENNLSADMALDFFKSLRMGKEDVEFFIENKDKVTSVEGSGVVHGWGGTRDSEAKKMSPLRKKLAQRLVAVKNETAMLTTFNEVNMTPIMTLRKQYKDDFKEEFGVGLGFMSFFTMAVTQALNEFPAVNAQISGDEIIYYDYADVGIAVSAPKGLVVPVLRNAEQMSLADIEKGIKELAIKARNNKITIEDMTGGTFTITNGGVFGSMMSTPIINPPQSAILGMHNIVERPIAVNGKVEIHPMMYLALSYDHRIIDGRESVGFLVKVKELLENPQNMIFGGKDPNQVLLGL